MRPCSRRSAPTPTAGAVVASSSGNVSFVGAHNFNPDTSAYLLGNKAEATAGNFTVGLVSLDVGSTIAANAKADLDVSVKSGATVRAGQHGQRHGPVEQCRRRPLREHPRRIRDC